MHTRKKLSEGVFRVVGMSETRVWAGSPTTADSGPALVSQVREIAVDKVGVVDRLQDASRRRRQAEIDEVAWVAAAADAWGWVDEFDETDPDDDPAGSGRGCPRARYGERLWRFGADGTPEVAEFVTHEIGPALQISPARAATLIGDVLDLRHRLPLLWQATLAGAVEVWVARQVARRTRRAQLSADQARLLDAYLSPHVHGWTPSRVFSRTDALIITVAPDLAEAKARQAAADRYVSVSRPFDGVVQLSARLDVTDTLDLDATVDRLAAALAAGGDERPAQQLRAVGLELLADPARAAALLATGDLPVGTGRRVDLVVHLLPEQLATGAGGDIVGLGPVAASQLQTLLADATTVTVLPVLDPLEEHSVEGYQPPAWMRQQIVLRDRFSTFPWSTIAADSGLIDLDHSRDWPHGPTSTWNLGVQDRKTHRGKTFAGFGLDHVRPGVFSWHTPTGQTAWVTPHGTYAEDPATSPLMNDIRRQAAVIIDAHQKALQAIRIANTPPPPF